MKTSTLHPPLPPILIKNAIFPRKPDLASGNNNNAAKGPKLPGDSPSPAKAIPASFSPPSLRLYSTHCRPPPPPPSSSIKVIAFSGNPLPASDNNKRPNPPVYPPPRSRASHEPSSPSTLDSFHHLVPRLKMPGGGFFQEIRSRGWQR